MQKEDFTSIVNTDFFFSLSRYLPGWFRLVNLNLVIFIAYHLTDENWCPHCKKKIVTLLIKLSEKHKAKKHKFFVDKEFNFIATHVCQSFHLQWYSLLSSINKIEKKSCRNCQENILYGLNPS